MKEFDGSDCKRDWHGRFSKKNTRSAKTEGLTRSKKNAKMSERARLEAEEFEKIKRDTFPCIDAYRKCRRPRLVLQKTGFTLRITNDTLEKWALSPRRSTKELPSNFEKTEKASFTIRSAEIATTNTTKSENGFCLLTGMESFAHSMFFQKKTLKMQRSKINA